jgi:hypothetical protein
MFNCSERTKISYAPFGGRENEKRGIPFKVTRNQWLKKLISIDRRERKVGNRHLFPVIQISKPGPTDLSFFGGWIEPNQFFVQLLGMGQIILVFFERGGFEQILRLAAIRTAEQHQTEGT